MTQETLSQKADVSLRSIQMYERRSKDINKAQAITHPNISKYRLNRSSKYPAIIPTIGAAVFSL